jgi:hypothetical protein
VNERQSGELDRALEAELERILAPPELPAQFRAKLQAALVRAGDLSPADTRSRLERERREWLAEIDQKYMRLKRRTLGTMIGGAFAAGAAAAIVMPWVTAQLGPIAPLVIACTGAVVGLGIAAASWLRSRGEFDSRVQL